MAKRQHIHRYERTILGKNNYVVFRCNLPDCPHYVPANLAKGKMTRCNRCNEPFILDNRAMKLVKPHCVDCIEVKKKDTFDPLLKFVEAHDIVVKEE